MFNKVKYESVGDGNKPIYRVVNYRKFVSGLQRERLLKFDNAKCVSMWFL